MRDPVSDGKDPGRSGPGANEAPLSFRLKLVERKYSTLSFANSIWFRDDGARFEINPDFLRLSAEYYEAGAFKADFSSSSTVKGINKWVSDETKGMTPQILDGIPENAVTCLINALSFEGEWPEIYNENQIRDGFFTKSDGSKQKTEFMYSEENVYLNDGERLKKIFALPKKGNRLQKNFPVRTSVPKFEAEYGTDSARTPLGMGMKDAFNPRKANFGALGSSRYGNIFISRVLHKTFFKPDEKGTAAGAATVVEAKDVSAVSEEYEYKTVYLDRPFVYMLPYLETDAPVLGITESPSGR